MAADMRAYKDVLIEMLHAYNDDSDPPRAPNLEPYEGRASSESTPVSQTIVYLGAVDFEDYGIFLGREPGPYHRWAQIKGSIVCVDPMPRWNACQDRAVALAAWLTSTYDIVSAADPNVVVANLSVGQVREMDALDNFQAAVAFGVGITFSAHLSQFPVDPEGEAENIVDQISLVWDPDGDGVDEETQLVP